MNPISPLEVKKVKSLVGNISTVHFSIAVFFNKLFEQFHYELRLYFSTTPALTFHKKKKTITR